MTFFSIALAAITCGIFYASGVHYRELSDMDDVFATQPRWRARAASRKKSARLLVLGTVCFLGLAILIVLGAA